MSSKPRKEPLLVCRKSSTDMRGMIAMNGRLGICRVISLKLVRWKLVVNVETSALMGSKVTGWSTCREDEMSILLWFAALINFCA